MSLVDPDSDSVSLLNWWVNGELSLIIWPHCGGLTSLIVLATLVPFPVLAVLRHLESHGLDHSFSAASVSSLLEGHFSHSVGVLAWEVDLPPLGDGILVWSIVHTSWRVKSWVLPVAIPERTGLEFGSQLGHCQFWWLGGFIEHSQFLLELLNFSLDFLDLVLVGLMLGLGSLLHQVRDFGLSLSQIGSGDQVRVRLQEAQRLLQALHLGQFILSHLREGLVLGLQGGSGGNSEQSEKC